MLDQLQALFAHYYLVSIADTHREHQNPYCKRCVRSLEYADKYCSKCGEEAGAAPAREPDMRFAVTLMRVPGECYPPRFYGHDTQAAVDKAFNYYAKACS